jgi:parallel beta-helix repeat protein
VLDGCRVLCEDAGQTGIHLLAGAGKAQGNVVRNCEIDSPTLHGIWLQLTATPPFIGANQVVGNRVIRPGADGIRLEGARGNDVSGNQVRENGEAAIRLTDCASNRARDNHLARSFANQTGTVGISSSGTASGDHNVIVQNRATGQETAYDLDEHDTYGPVINTPSALDGETNAWANFEF